MTTYSHSGSSDRPRQDIVIFGTGGFARLAYVYLSKDSPYRVAAFTVHRAYLNQEKLFDLDVVAFERIEESYPPEKYSIFVAIGYAKLNQARARVYETCRSKGYKLISYVSSKAVHWGEFEIGDNCFIFENTVIHPFVSIGDDVIIGSGNHIGHDTTIGDHCFIAGHAMIPGYVRIGPYSFIGGNATLKDGISVAPRSVIGAGAIILRDTKEGGVYVAESTQAGPVHSSMLGPFMLSPYFAKGEEKG